MFSYHQYKSPILFVHLTTRALLAPLNALFLVIFGQRSNRAALAPRNTLFLVKGQIELRWNPVTHSWLPLWSEFGPLVRFGPFVPNGPIFGPNLTSGPNFQ